MKKNKIIFFIGALFIGISLTGCGSKKDCGRCPYESIVVKQEIENRA